MRASSYTLLALWTPPPSTPSTAPPAGQPRVPCSPPVLAGIGERAVQRLAIGDRHVAGLGDDRHRLRQALGAGLGHPGRNVDLAQLVRARHHPNAVGGGRAVELA